MGGSGTGPDRGGEGGGVDAIGSHTAWSLLGRFGNDVDRKRGWLSGLWCEKYLFDGLSFQLWPLM